MEEKVVRSAQIKTDFAYVDDGVLMVNAPLMLVQVESGSDLTNLTQCKPGTIAFTAGFATIWQLGTSGTWAEVE